MRVLALAALAATANGLKVEVCSDSLNDLGIKDVVLPEVVVAGRTMVIDVVQVPNKYVNKGTVRVELDVEGVKVAGQSHELCSTTTCHLLPHQESQMRFNMDVPENTPVGMQSTLKIIVNDHNGAQLSCVEATGVELEAKEMSADKPSFRVGEMPNVPLSLAELEFMFERWMHEFGMDIKSSEMVNRMKVFGENLASVAEHNARGDSSFTLGLNQFAHLTHEEFAATYLGYNGGENGPTVNREFYSMDVETLGLTDLPEEVNWVEKGAVTPVKNQGSCGSCWAFSTTGALEGAYFLKTGTLKSFSEQELVSCDHVDQGCNGGLMDNADRFIQKAGGLCEEDAFPYVSGTGRRASCSKCTPVDGTVPSKIVDVAHAEGSLEEAVAKRPVSVAIEADQLSFQFYRRGVLTGSCGRQLDHGVLVAGYGVLDGKKYWRVKNSWGPSYGQSGYVLVQRGKSVRGGECGILLSASYPEL